MHTDLDLLVPVLAGHLPGHLQRVPKDRSLMDKVTAARYRKIILEKGSSQDAKVFIEEFLGRKYETRAFEEWLHSGQL